MAATLILLAMCSAGDIQWRSLHEGVEYTTIQWQTKPSHGDGKLHVVRIDHKRVRVVAKAASIEGGKLYTAAQWATRSKLSVVINAGMYESDFSTHTGYFRVGDATNSAKWVKTYKSVLLLGPRKKGAAVTIVDATLLPPAAESYATVIQNLRLMAAPGRNVWKENGKRWSEAAIARDKHGRLLFLFSRTPYSMHDFNKRLLESELEITHAMHAEGGPEASLSIHAGGVDLDLSGSFETGFNEDDGNAEQWPLPNVVGVVGK